MSQLKEKEALFPNCKNSLNHSLWDSIMKTCNQVVTLITKNTHWARSNVNFDGVSYKNTSCKETIARINT